MIPAKHDENGAHLNYDGVLVDYDCSRCAYLTSHPSPLLRANKDEVGRLWDLAYRNWILRDHADVLSQADHVLTEELRDIQLTLERFGWPLGVIPELPQAARVQVAGKTT